MYRIISEQLLKNHNFIFENREQKTPPSKRSYMKKGHESQLLVGRQWRPQHRQVGFMPRVCSMNLPLSRAVKKFHFSDQTQGGLQKNKRLALFRSKPKTNIIICSCLFK